MSSYEESETKVSDTIKKMLSGMKSFPRSMSPPPSMDILKYEYVVVEKNDELLSVLESESITDSDCHTEVEPSTVINALPIDKTDSTYNTDDVEKPLNEGSSTSTSRGVGGL